MKATAAKCKNETVATKFMEALFGGKIPEDVFALMQLERDMRACHNAMRALSKADELQEAVSDYWHKGGNIDQIPYETCSITFTEVNGAMEEAAERLRYQYQEAMEAEGLGSEYFNELVADWPIQDAKILGSLYEKAHMRWGKNQVEAALETSAQVIALILKHKGGELARFNIDAKGLHMVQPEA